MRTLMATGAAEIDEAAITFQFVLAELVFLAAKMAIEPRIRVIRERSRWLWPRRYCGTDTVFIRALEQHRIFMVRTAACPSPHPN